MGWLREIRENPFIFYLVCLLYFFIFSFPFIFLSYIDFFYCPFPFIPFLFLFITYFSLPTESHTLDSFPFVQSFLPLLSFYTFSIPILSVDRKTRKSRDFFFFSLLLFPFLFLFLLFRSYLLLSLSFLFYSCFTKHTPIHREEKNKGSRKKYEIAFSFLIFVF
jgi:heme O synthase-like polyprenyltransferase